MQKSTTSGQNQAVDAFLECVARCLAKRWLKIQRNSYQIDVCSSPEKTPTAETGRLQSKPDVGAPTELT